MIVLAGLTACGSARRGGPAGDWKLVIDMRHAVGGYALD